MRNAWDHERLRDRILAAANDVDLTTAADISRATNDRIKPGQLSKWLRGVEQPAVASLRILAPVLRIPLSELLVLAGRADEAELDIEQLPEAPATPQLHPYAYEVDRRLNDRSPLSTQDREAYAALIETVNARFPLRKRGRATG